MKLLGHRRFAVALVCLALVAIAGICKLGRAESDASKASKTPNTLSPEELADGWLLLFDGETLFGWRPAGKTDWRIDDGVLWAAGGEPGLLLTTSQFGNYTLKADFRADAGTESGIFLRTSPKPTDLATRCYALSITQPKDGPEIKHDSDSDTGPNFPIGSLKQRKQARQLPADSSDASDWRTLEVTADRGHFLIQLDGQTVLDYSDPKPLGRGFIGLQWNQGKIEFRNVKLKPLGTQNLFNGRNLDGWKTYPDMLSTFSVTPEGWLHVSGGKGQLETEGQYDDFTLQLEVFVGGKGLNSGIFFRSIPGDPMNGYESQIHNGFVDGDRTSPQDGGTGGIFRRVDARKVVADDFQWFSKTIHADDKHMAVWVNGYQVTDWTDTRAPDENPRRGLRLEPGTIIIQGHDPTTDFSFRNLQIGVIPER